MITGRKAQTPWFLLVLGVFSLLLGMVVTTPVSAAAPMAVHTKFAEGTTTQLPACDWAASVSWHTGNNFVSLSASYSHCDLMVSDALFSPKICVYTFNLKHWDASRDYCKNHEQNQTAGALFAFPSCHVGDPYVVDINMFAWRTMPWTPQILHAEIRFDCGS